MSTMYKNRLLDLATNQVLLLSNGNQDCLRLTFLPAMLTQPRDWMIWTLMTQMKLQVHLLLMAIDALAEMAKGGRNFDPVLQSMLPVCSMIEL